MLTGDELAGFPVININEGTLKPGCKTDSGTHAEAEIYLIVDCEEGACSVWLNDEQVMCRKQDVIIIPPNTRHHIDNTASQKPFVLLTLWPRQEQNGVYHSRLLAWGTAVALLDPAYQQKRVLNK